ncbi:MAG: SLC13 family permease [Opitutaceae bacterium]|nr:SLC13 family permease [Opitutaceae bacterium]
MTNLPWKPIGLAAGGIVFAAMLLFYNPVPENPKVGFMASIAALMAILWISEAIPLAATAFIPVIALPLTGIIDAGTITKSYVNSIVFLFIGGFLIALSMERWNLHRRIALNIINAIGKRADLMVLGFMVASGFLSMWISNTATAVMMLPIGLAIISKMEDAFGKKRTHGLSLAIMLGIAYGASIGGVSTLVGTPTNLAFVRIFQESFPEAPPIEFGKWILIGIPYSASLMLVVWFLLTRFLCRVDPSLTLDRAVIHKELTELGPLKSEEKLVLFVFASTVFLWLFRKDLHIGAFNLPGWSNLWSGFANIDDGTIAIAMALILFVLPAQNDSGAHRILENDAFKKLPWAIILLFGGGFALASGFGASGLSQHIGQGFQAIGEVPTLVLIIIICLSVTFLTELTSNVATLSMLLPILATWAVSVQVHPLLFAIPATISSSMAFMMPVATPPNAVVFGSQRIRIAEMARTGLLLNLIAVVFTVIATYLLMPAFIESPIGDFPDWAK